MPDLGAGGQAPAPKPGVPNLSTQAADGKPAVNARDRIGNGPWKNSKGAVVAKDVAELQRHQRAHQAERALREGRKSSTAAATHPTATTC